jgi:TatD DNase family protein
MFVDSHCHLNMLDLVPFNGDLANVLAKADENQVKYFLCVGVTLNDHPELAQIADKYPNVYISTGLHPNENAGNPLDTEILFQNAQHPKVIAIGETGLDYFRSEGSLDWQRERFRQHIDCAKRCQKPLIIHTRDAKEDTIAIMRQEKVEDIGGVMHCFTEDWETAKQALDLGFYISFSGIVTFKNATTLHDVAKKVPLERMLVETDSPYLAPVPYRGKPNIPAYVRHVGEYIAELRGEPVDKIAQMTTDNFFRLFHVSA